MEKENAVEAVRCFYGKVCYGMGEFGYFLGDYLQPLGAGALLTPPKVVPRQRSRRNGIVHRSVLTPLGENGGKSRAVAKKPETPRFLRANRMVPEGGGKLFSLILEAKKDVELKSTSIVLKKAPEAPKEPISRASDDELAALRLARDLDVEDRAAERLRRAQEMEDMRLAQELAEAERKAHVGLTKVEEADLELARRTQATEVETLEAEARKVLRSWRRPRVKARNLPDNGGVEVSCLLPCLKVLRVMVDPRTAEVAVTARPDLGAGGRAGWDRTMLGEFGSEPGKEGVEADHSEFAAEGTLARFAAAVRTGLVCPKKDMTARSVQLALDLRIVGKTECSPDDVTAQWDRQTGWVTVAVKGATLEGGAQDGELSDEEEAEEKTADTKTTWRGTSFLHRAAAGLKRAFSRKENTTKK